MTNGTAIERRPIEVVGLCLKPDAPAAGAAARELSSWLREQGHEVLVESGAPTGCDAQVAERSVLVEKADLMLVLGGDGTILSVARALGDRPVPILGINLGALGFLAEVNPHEQQVMLARVLAGEFETQARMRLSVLAHRGEREILRANALNDAVITRSDLSRMIDLEAHVGGGLVTTYHGDGLIVATPTGSTAYTLSAGGPILIPGARVFVVTPICPHTLSQRPLVFPETARLEIKVHPRDGGAQLTVDGQVGVSLEEGDSVAIAADAPPAYFVVSPDRSRFEALRTKLGWGAG